MNRHLEGRVRRLEDRRRRAIEPRRLISDAHLIQAARRIVQRRRAAGELDEVTRRAASIIDRFGGTP